MSSTPIVAQVVQHLAPGGIETMALDLQRKSATPENIHIISLEGNHHDSVAKWPRIKQLQRIHFLDKKPGLSTSTISQLYQLLKKLNVNVIHSHHVGPLLYGGIAAKMAGCRHVHTEHDAWHLTQQKRRWLVSACFHLLRPAVAADARLVADNMQQHIPLFTPSVILNGIDTDTFRPADQGTARQKLNLPTDVPIIGCAGRFTAVKCHDVLIQAFAKLPNHTHLALAGGGELEQSLKSLAKKLHVDQRVHFLGVLDDMPTFYQAIDVFCLASKKEGLPLSPLEAQACQTVVVITDVGGCREAVDPASGILIAAGDIQALTSALQKQLTDGITPEKQISAREFVVNHGNLERMINQYHQLYLGRAM